MNALLVNKEYKSVLSLYDDVNERKELFHNSTTFIMALNACGKVKDLEKGKEIHSSINIGDLENPQFLCNALLHFYGECRSFEDVQDMWEVMESSGDVLSFNSMMTACLRSEKYSEVLDIFEKMKNNPLLSPDDVSFTLVLTACAEENNFEIGDEIVRKEIFEKGKLNNSMGENLLSSILHFYGNCGRVDLMERYRKDVKSTSVYTALIGGYAKNGYSEKALEIFEEMKGKGIERNEKTYVNALLASTNSGDIAKARDIIRNIPFSQMTVTIHTCLVDNMGKQGFVEDALEYIENQMVCGKIKPDIITWRTLLGASRLYSNLKIGRKAMDEIIQIDPFDISSRILIREIYASLGDEINAKKEDDEIKKIRKKYES